MKLLGLMMIFAALTPAQVATNANRSYDDAAGRKRMINLLSDPERPGRLQAEKLVASLGLQAGQTAVDLGTGAGMLLPYLSRAVGNSGRVIAEDIHEDFLAVARETATKEHLKNVEFVVGGERTPNLPQSAANVVVVVDAYHHFNFPKLMLAGIRAGLRDDGRFVIVDYYKAGFQDPDHIRADKPEVIREVEAGGFHLVADREHVAGTQYLVVFEKRAQAGD